MASFVAVSELQEHLSELLARVEGGEEIVIQREGRPAIHMLSEATTERRPDPRIGGQNVLGVTYMAADCFDPMTEEELAEWGL